MIVCSCNVLSDADIRTVVRAETPRTAGEIYGCLGCSPQCGRCVRTVMRIMNEVQTAPLAACAPGCVCCARRHRDPT